MNYKITNSTNPTKKETEQIMDIVKQNHISNGGELCYTSLVLSKYDEDIIVMAKQNNKIIAFTLLTVYKYKNTLYVMQVAVDNDHKHTGIGTQMYNYIKEHSKGFNTLTAHIKQANFASMKFHKQNGFKILDKSSDQVFCGCELLKQKNQVDFQTNKDKEITTNSNENEF